MTNSEGYKKVPEQNTENTRLKIEDDLIAALSGNKLKYALAYVDCMKASGMARDTGGGNAFGSADGYVCQICINPIGYHYAWSVCMGGWDSVLHRSAYQNFPIDDDVKAFAWAHVRPCTNFSSNGKECGCGFQPGRRVMLFGKEFCHTCHGGVEFGDLDGESLELAKRLTDVWAQSMADAANQDKPYVPGENEWLPVKGSGAQTGRPLGKAYTKSLDVQFFITPRRRYAWDAAVGFSGGGWVPVTRAQLPVGLNLCSNSRIEAYKGPNEGWTSVETLKYQANVMYCVEMSINITDNTFSATVWMLDSGGKQDTPYSIAKDFPFRLGGDPAIPTITAIDTVYLGQDDSHILAFTVKDFKVVGGE